MAEDSPQVVMLCRDLMFTSKVTAASRSAGVPVRVVRDAKGLEGIGGAKLIVDLGQEGAIDAAAAWKARTGGSVVGFVSHVDEATIGRAKGAGIDRVMSRGGFSASVEDVLRGGD
jgi:hypothetical protein